ncbi:MAG: ornithine carbamoyltransferase [Planctomycetota bacterium]|jgi:ornithine carbamoyltransferase|nr:ornithine carbamoyltransferase [Planctomycetota bacterium]
MTRPRHLITLADWSPENIESVIRLARNLKTQPSLQENQLAGKTLLQIFEKPSLRTRLSFEAGMTRMGGHAIFYSLRDSVFGSKESIEDTARASSRFVDCIMARLFEHENIVRLAQAATVPVINGLTDHSHPCQILADLVTVEEALGRLRGVRLAFLGDCHNNVTHSLLTGCSKMGVSISLGCPSGSDYEPQPEILAAAKKWALESESDVRVFQDPLQAVEGADVIYTDTWMSYQIPENQKNRRIEIFRPYQVTSDLMSRANPGAIFMHCLPAQRGYEQTAEVIDGPASIVFDQAENRLWAQNALLLNLLDRTPEEPIASKG